MMLRQLLCGFALSLCFALSSFGGALSLDGNNDYVTLPGAAGVFPSGSSAFTIQAWINPDVHGDRTMTFWGNQSGNQANGFRLRGGNGTRHYFWGNDDDKTSGDLSPNTGGPNSDGWHHIGITYDGNQTQWYLDGAALGTPRVAGAVNVADGNHRIGSRLGGEFFDGLIDELSVWDTDLSAAEIASNFDTKLSGSEANLVAYYDFEDGTSDDLVGIADGVLQDGAFVTSSENAPVQPLPPAVVPEPASIAIWSLLGFCLAVFGYYRQRGKNS